LQLSNVAGPLVGFEQLNRFLVDSSEVLSGFFPEPANEVFNEQGMSSLRSRKEGI